MNLERVNKSQSCWCCWSVTFTRQQLPTLTVGSDQHALLDQLLPQLLGMFIVILRRRRRNETAPNSGNGRVRRVTQIAASGLILQSCFQKTFQTSVQTKKMTWIIRMWLKKTFMETRLMFLHGPHSYFLTKAAGSRKADWMFMLPTGMLAWNCGDIICIVGAKSKHVLTFKGTTLYWLYSYFDFSSAFGHRPLRPAPGLVVRRK